MTRSLTRRELERIRQDTGLANLSETIAAELAEIEENLPAVVPESRCHVCTCEEGRELVNRLLGLGLTYREIHRQVGHLNESLPKREKLTYASIRIHHKRHFDTQGAAKAVIRRIVEERAAQQGKDFLNGVGSLVNLHSYLEVMQNKGFEQLASSTPNVSVRDGLHAARLLHILEKEDEKGKDAAAAYADLQKIITAVKKHVDPGVFDLIVAELDDHPETETGEFRRSETAAIEEDDDEPFDPQEDVDDRDTLEM